MRLIEQYLQEKNTKKLDLYGKAFFVSPSGTIFGHDERTDDYDTIEHKWYVRDNYEKFGLTKEDLKDNSSNDLLEIVICKGFVRARINKHSAAYISVSTVNRTRKQLEEILFNILDCNKLEIEEYGLKPFTITPRLVFQGTAREFLRQLYESNNNVKQFLREKKDHLIKKLNINKDEKDVLISFFNKHPNYENKIDWSNKDLTFKDFETVLKSQEESKSNIKRRTAQGELDAIWKSRGKDDYKIWWQDENNIYVSPLNFECARFMTQSAYNISAKWCIGVSDPHHWNQYMRKERLFMMRYSKNQKRKWMFEIDYQDAGRYEFDIWNEDDTVEASTSKAKDPICDRHLLIFVGPIVNNYNKKNPRDERNNLVTGDDWRTFERVLKELYDLYEEKNVFKTYSIDEDKFMEEAKSYLRLAGLEKILMYADYNNLRSSKVKQNKDEIWNKLFAEKDRFMGEIMQLCGYNTLNDDMWSSCKRIMPQVREYFDKFIDECF